MELNLDRRITRAELALRAGMSESALATAFSTVLGRSPIDHLIVLTAQISVLVAQDLLFGPTLRRFPDLKVALSEGGIGWIPFYLDRADRHFQNQAWLDNDFGGKLPSDVFRDHILACYITDPSGLELRHRIGIDIIAWECDYPHTDTTWPESPEFAWKEFQDSGCTAEEINMATPVQLVTGLGGAIGCDFRSSHNQLVFVEYAGKLSRLNLFHPATIVSSGTAVLKGTFLLDLETGAEGGAGPAMDIWWEQQTNVLRQMTPQNGARLVNLGVVDFASIDSASLQSLPYASTPIPGNNNATNKLVTGDVFAVRTQFSF